MGIREDLEAMDDFYNGEDDGYPPTETLISDVKKFTELAGGTTDQFNVRQTALYIGLQLEEMAEKLTAVFGGHSPHIADRLMSVSLGFKEGDFDDAIEACDAQDLLDADVDLAWVTIGSMLSQGADVLGAIGEVTRANMDKFPGGVVTKDCNGKVKKPQGWKGPDLSGFVCK